MKPISVVNDRGEAIGLLKPGDVVVFFNFRNDRAKELTIALTQKDLQEFGKKTMPLHYCTMTPYDATFTGLHVIYPKVNLSIAIGRVLQKLKD
jgi:2,3-bisphosphoglycerate-independent phosphoglycerate mutase